LRVCATRPDLAANLLRERGLTLVVHIQDAVFSHKSVVLLSVVRNSRRERRHVPMQMGVALLAAQGEAVQPLGGHHSGYSLGCAPAGGDGAQPGLPHPESAANRSSRTAYVLIVAQAA
jgi:hypothetical protein